MGEQRWGLAFSFDGNRNLRPSPSLSAALGSQTREQRALVLLSPLRAMGAGEGRGSW